MLQVYCIAIGYSSIPFDFVYDSDPTSSVTKGLVKGTFKPERDVRSPAGYCGIGGTGVSCPVGLSV